MVNTPYLHISTLEKEIGLPKDTLRVWERRYGFPQPIRDDKGERRYPPEQIQQLRLIRHLIDYGPRPRDIVGKSLDELNQIAVDRNLVTSLKPEPHLQRYLKLIQAHHPARLREVLKHDLVQQELKRFVLDTVAPLTIYINDACLRGKLHKFEEHLYSEQAQMALRNAINNMRSKPEAPEVLLTTFPGEQHTLNLLMIESLLKVRGTRCISLGTQTPLLDIVAAARALQTEIVMLTFSTHYPARMAVNDLRELRTLLPGETAIWSSGIGAGRIRSGMPGVTLLTELDQIDTALDQWNRGRA